jgi:hypothetical protein
MDPLVDRSLDRLRSAVERAKRKESVQWRVQLVRDPSTNDPPLAQLLRGGPGRGGRSGDVRLKLYLTLAMRATRAPHDIGGVPAYVYAEMLGLPDPARSGARRIASALRWLGDHDFVTLKDPGRGAPAPMRVHYLREKEVPYPSIPIQMWTEGWIVRLPGRAIALYLILRELTGGRPTGAHATGRRKDEYGLSADTWTRAAADLEEAGLLTIEEFVDYTDLRQGRRRLRYRLTENGLARPAYP